MISLVINAPKAQVNQNKKKSFRETFKSGVGQGYAINRSLFKQISPGCKVVLLSKDQKLRAEGILVKTTPTFKTKNGIQRYDVFINGFELVAYKSEALNRNGVAVLTSELQGQVSTIDKLKSGGVKWRKRGRGGSGDGPAPAD